MLQCEAGYGTCADKRIEIAEHLKYLPMGYFNQNSLGYIASVATNSMETLADVATPCRYDGYPGHFDHSGGR